MRAVVLRSAEMVLGRGTDFHRERDRADDARVPPKGGDFAETTGIPATAAGRAPMRPSPPTAPTTVDVHHMR